MQNVSRDLAFCARKNGHYRHSRMFGKVATLVCERNGNPYSIVRVFLNHRVNYITPTALRLAHLRTAVSIATSSSSNIFKRTYLLSFFALSFCRTNTKVISCIKSAVVYEVLASGVARKLRQNP
jgi:hypothetical protein